MINTSRSTNENYAVELKLWELVRDDSSIIPEKVIRTRCRGNQGEWTR